MGALCSRSGVQVPVRPVASNVVSTARKASEAAQRAASDACAMAERAQLRASETIEQLKQSLQANESSAIQKVDAATEQAVKALEAQPDKIMMLSAEDQKILEEAKKKIAEQHHQEQHQQAEGKGEEEHKQSLTKETGTTNSFPPKSSNSKSATSSPIAYLFYSPERDGGSLLQQWVQQPMTEEDIKQKKLIQLASFIPAPHKTVPKARLQQNGGATVFIKEIMYRWDIWGKAQRQAYYQGWVKFLKAADDMEGKVELKEFGSPAPPATVFILHTSPTENKVLEVKPDKELAISLFGFVAAVPSSSVYKSGANLSSKRFGDLASEAGGAYMQLSRRGGDAAFDQQEVLKWLEADGLKAGGGPITMSQGGDTYERRSEQKGGEAPQQPKEALGFKAGGGAITLTQGGDTYGNRSEPKGEEATQQKKEEA
nr:immune mapped protein 1 [Eimeria intestinalis]